MFPGETILTGAPNGDDVSDIKVMKSGGGWYLGTTITDPDFGYEEPYTRESEYFGTEQKANIALMQWQADNFIGARK